MFVLPFKGFDAIDSKVFLPIITGIPHVVFLKNFMSFGNFHNNALPSPMALSSDAATTIDIYMLLIYIAIGALMAG
jgi:hypothetical protein